MKKVNITAVILLVFVSVSCSQSTPTTPATPKKKASIELELKNKNWGGYSAFLLIKGTAMISCTNEVGGRITYLDVTLYKENEIICSYLFDGGTVQPYGKLMIDFGITVSWAPEDRKTRPFKLMMRIEGTDNSDYKIDISRYWTLQ